MPELFFLCFMGFCAGIIVAGGVSGLLIGLSIVPRYAGITHTAECIFLYEDTIFSMFQVNALWIRISYVIHLHP